MIKKVQVLRQKNKLFKKREIFLISKVYKARCPHTENILNRQSSSPTKTQCKLLTLSFR